MLERDVPLSDYSTIALGGPARYFLRCRSVEQVREGLIWAQEQALPVQVLGGGSNTIFADTGFSGLVLKIELSGIDLRERGATVEVTAAAGQDWDGLVQWCIERDLAGLECLSGIPGSVGATPIQNVGAYGQEVGDTLVSLRALDRQSLERVEFSAADCRLSYRQSRFKRQDRDRYVILEVGFGLRRGGRPTLRYAELERRLRQRADLEVLPAGRPALQAAREAVLALRRDKSMLADPDDPCARSVGSFFLNPVLSPPALEQVRLRWRCSGGTDEIPVFPAPAGLKVPAAWLVERAGFPRGYRRGGVGVSPQHALALVNYGGTTAELLALAGEIQAGVQDTFGLHLEIEPTIVR
ncbi:MAG: UDP-N-acetylmuramate dehydrogenase [Chloroflexia bacterium]|nr:UDP-N-acetylmuramate dehydrogenase [Chloroflexia bacterium]